MPIVRSHHDFDDQFTRIPNSWLRDERLSLKAKGLLGQIMSHSPGWTLSVASLATANGCGRDLIRSAIAELEEVGYLRRRQLRGDDGQFSETLWETCDPAEPTVSEKPLSENPTSDNTTTKKNITLEEQEKEIHPQPSVEDEQFERFWNAYPRKVEKLEARKAFGKAYAEHGSAVVMGSIAMAGDPNLPPKQFIPYPAAWLRAGGWTNEPYPERERTKAELEAIERERIRKRDDAERERQRRLREQAEREAQDFTPPPRCVHDRIAFRCPTCKQDSENDN